MSAKEKKSSNMPEFLRRFFVALKRQPSMIALVVLIIAFFYYSLNLTPGMGLSGFATMLFSMLSLVCFLNAFPKRKKPVLPMVVLMFVMFGIIIYCDYHYSGLIMTALTREVNPIKLDASTTYIAQAYNVLQNHMILEGVGVVLVLLMPVYSKLLRKINTSITVEDNGKLDVIDISGED